jgi:hypothetical protein
MRDRNGNQRAAAAVVAAAAAAFVLPSAAARAANYVYDFDNGQVVGSSGDGTPLIDSTTAGTVGQDNWVLTSGASSVVRTDPISGFSGNYATSPTITGSPSLDGILTRKNDANFSYSLAGSSQLVLTMDVLVGPAGGGSTQFRRSEMALGVDLNEDGKIRPTSATVENPEIAFMYGYEIGLGWYVRQASFGSNKTYLPAAVPDGVWEAQLIVDLAANQATVKDNSTGDNITGYNGSGSLYVKQLSDAGGNPVSDVFHAVDKSLLNFDLGIMRMASVNGGAQWASDPNNWDGMMIRTAGNGGLDNISISTDPLTASPQWALNGAGSWTNDGNWYPSSTPNGVGAVADFGAALTAPHTVYADTDVTVGTLHVNNANTYVFAGAGSLTLQTATGNAQVLVDTGTQKINLPLTVASDTVLNVATGATLKISDPVTIMAGKSVTQTGGGAVSYESNVTLQTGASLAVGSSSSMHALSLAADSLTTLTSHTGGTAKVLQVDTLSLGGSTDNWAGTLDLTNNDLVIRHGALADVANQLKAGYNAGGWNGPAGIVSSAARADSSHALAYASAATIFGLTGSATATFDGQAVDASSLLVKYTWFGDANFDGTLDADDFALLDRGRAKGLAGWTNGDFNYDGAVTVDDYALIDHAFFVQNGTLSPEFLATRAAQFGDAYVSALVASVPEPTTLSLLGVGAGLALGRRRRRAR